MGGSTGEGTGEITVKDTLELATSDSNHVLYLHHSDHPNYVLATQLLNENNYHHWRRSVEVSLTAKNKLSFVTGAYPKPEADSPLVTQWTRCNSMVISWIIHSVEKDIAETLLYYGTASEMWDDLKLRFGQPNSARMYQLQKELFNICQGNSSISSYYTRFKKHWDEYQVLVEMPKCNKCGVLTVMPQMFTQQQVLQFLVGLNDIYSVVRGNVLMMRPIPPIGEVYQMVLREEKQRSLNTNSANSVGDSSAFSVFPKPSQSSSNSSLNPAQNYNSKTQSNISNGQSKSGQGSGNQYTGNNRNLNQTGSQKNKPYYFCDHCQVPGHSISRCFKIHGYPKDYKERKFAGNSNGSQEGGKDESDRVPNFTKEQYEKIMALLSQQQFGKNTTDDNRSCMLAGPFNEQVSGSW